MAEINLTLNIPDGKVAEFVDDYSAFHGYQAQVWDEETGTMVANPQTKRQFMKQQIVAHIKESIRIYRARKAQELATNVDDVVVS